MIDRNVKYFDLFMLYMDLSNIKEVPLPDGYSYRFFDGSDEDIQHWMDIEVSSGDVTSYDAAREGFETYYAAHIEKLSYRCIFLLNENMQPIGTATAFFLVENQPGLPEISKNPLPLPEKVSGHLHWVAIKEEYKGKGLSKSLITKTMKQMHKLGHQAAFLHSQTPSYLACKIYLDLGWNPFRFIQSEENFKEGWDIVKKKSNELKR